MKTYYICSKQAMHQNAMKCFKQWHAIDLPDGRVLMAGTIRDENLGVQWSQHSEVEEMPHPMSGDSISLAHHNALKHLGVTPNDSTLKVAKKLAKVNPMLAL